MKKRQKEHMKLPARLLTIFYRYIYTLFLVMDIQLRPKIRKFSGNSVLIKLWNDLQELAKNLDSEHYLSHIKIVFCVSALEIFLKNCFIFMVDNNERLKNKILDSDKKIPIKNIKPLLEKKYSLGEVISDKYKFQNLSDINNAFDWLLKIRFSDLIDKDFKKDGKKYNALKTLVEVLEIRHNFIHEGKTKKLKKKDIFVYYNCFVEIGFIFIQKIEKLFWGAKKSSDS